MSELNINGIITILAVIAYGIVFLIQKTQIDKQNNITKYMETFINIFKVDEVIKYSNMREETTEINIKNYLSKNENVNKIINESAKVLEDKYRNEFNKGIRDRYEELFMFSVKVINSSKEEDREILYESLKNNRENIEKIISDLNKNNL